jgi:hypothetical protein
MTAALPFIGHRFHFKINEFFHSGEHDEVRNQLKAVRNQVTATGVCKTRGTDSGNFFFGVKYEIPDDVLFCPVENAEPWIM